MPSCPKDFSGSGMPWASCQTQISQIPHLFGALNPVSRKFSAEQVSSGYPNREASQDWLSIVPCTSQCPHHNIPCTESNPSPAPLYFPLGTGRMLLNSGSWFKWDKKPPKFPAGAFFHTWFECFNMDRLGFDLVYSLHIIHSALLRVYWD